LLTRAVQELLRNQRWLFRTATIKEWQEAFLSTLQGLLIASRPLVAFAPLPDCPSDV
jgi:hypothetical protein